MATGKSPIGITRAGVVYELFFTNLPQQAFTARDVVESYLNNLVAHRGGATQSGSQRQNEACSVAPRTGSEFHRV